MAKTNVTIEDAIEMLEVILSGLKAGTAEPEADENEVKAAPKKPAGKKTKKAEPEPAGEEDEDTKDYSSMSSKDLYALCCERGLSSKCKKRDKATLIAILKEADGAGEEPETEDDDRDEESEEEPKKDPYAGKNARELYDMCKERGIKVPTKKPAEFYADKLKEADAAKAEDSEEDEDDWEI